MFYSISRYDTIKQTLCFNVQQYYSKMQNLKKWRCFKNFTNTGISDPLFTRLWTLTTDFVLIQVNAGYGFCIDKSECKLRIFYWYKRTQALIHALTDRADWYYWFTKNTANHLLKSFHLQVWEFLRMNF